MDSQGKPTTPDAAAPSPKAETTFRAELEFHLGRQQLVIRSKCPTVILEGMLGDGLLALGQVTPAGLPTDGVVRVDLAYDMEADRLVLTAAAPRLVVGGVLLHALGGVTRNQMAQKLQVERQAVEKRLADLEKRLGAPKILLP